MPATLETARLILTSPRIELAQSALDFVRDNREHLAPWSPPAPDGLYTLAHWEEAVAKAGAAESAGTAVRFWMTPREAPGRVIGSIGFSQIFRGPFCACVLGYQIARDHEGRGLMKEALAAAIGHMFRAHRVHRIGANYRPENVRSGRLLAGLGFRIEGYAKDYLYIDGAWRDHILTSKSNPAFDAGWLRPG